MIGCKKKTLANFIKKNYYNFIQNKVQIKWY